MYQFYVYSDTSANEDNYILILKTQTKPHVWLYVCVWVCLCVCVCVFVCVCVYMYVCTYSDISINEDNSFRNHIR